MLESSARKLIGRGKQVKETSQGPVNSFSSSSTSEGCRVRDSHCTFFQYGLMAGVQLGGRV